MDWIDNPHLALNMECDHPPKYLNTLTFKFPTFKYPHSNWKVYWFWTSNPLIEYPWHLPVSLDDSHIINTRLITVRQLFETDLSLSVNWIIALSLNFRVPFCIMKLKLGKLQHVYKSFKPLLCLSFGKSNKIATPLATCSPTWVNAKNK